MAAMNTPKIVLPVEVAQGILRKAQNNSTIQALSPSTPALFKNCSKVKQVGAYDVKRQGSSTSAKCFSPDIDARTPLRVIRGRSDHGGGDDVRLLDG